METNGERSWLAPAVLVDHSIWRRMWVAETGYFSSVSCVVICAAEGELKRSLYADLVLIGRRKWTKYLG